jgi:tetratricopeptide (TPR) repeat protein
VVGAQERAQPYLEKMARLKDGAGDGARAWYALAHGMVSRFREGKLWEAYEEIREARAIFERIGDRRQAAMHALTTSDMERELHDLRAAEEHARWALAEAERLGERQTQLMAMIKVASLRALAGHREDVEALAATADFGDNHLYAAILQLALGEARLAAGDLEGAEAALRRALQGLPGPPLRVQALASLARVLAASGRQTEATSVAEDALKLIAPLGHGGGHGPRVRFAVAQVFRAAGDLARASAEHAAAVTELRAVAAGLPPEARERYLAAPDHVALLAALY